MGTYRTENNLKSSADIQQWVGSELTLSLGGGREVTEAWVAMLGMGSFGFFQNPPGDESS